MKQDFGMLMEVVLLFHLDHHHLLLLSHNLNLLHQLHHHHHHGIHLQSMRQRHLDFLVMGILAVYFLHHLNQDCHHHQNLQFQHHWESIFLLYHHQ